MDYKEILKKKAINLRSLLYTYKDELSEEEFNSIKITIDNALLSIDGRLDALDYDVRNEAIMNWHDRLDSAISSIDNRFSNKEHNNKNLYSWEEEVTKSEFKEMKKDAKSEALEDAELVGSFFKTLAITVVAIAVVAAILFVISRMVKSPKDYIEMLAMSNSAFIIYLLGFLLNAIFSYIYAPIGVVLFGATLIFAVIALANAFRESIEVEDTNKLVIYSSIVLSVVFAILVIIAVSYVKASLGGLSSLLDI